MDFLELPKEILEKIFVFLSGKDILRLNQTCKLLDLVIGDSLKIMNKLKLYVNPDNLSDLDTILRSVRKYQTVNMKFSDFVPCAVFDILEKFSGTLNDVVIHHSVVRSNEFQRILSIIPKLHHLKLRKVQYFQNLTSCIHPGEGNSIDTLEMDESSLQLLQHFKGMDIREFLVICYQEESDNIGFVIDFLESQKNLEALTLQGTIPYHLFLNNHSEKFQFSLKYFVIRFLVFLTREELIDNFTTFLRKQQKSLLHFDSDIINEEILRIILNDMENLKHLGIQAFGKRLPSNFATHDIFQINPSLKSLEFDFSQEFPYEEIIKFTPHVEELTLKALQISYKLIVAIFHELKSLHQLKIWSCKFQNFLWLPTVKTLIFEETDSSQIAKFLLCNRQIEKLKINGKIDGEIRESIKHHKNLRCFLQNSDGDSFVIRHFFQRFN